MPPAAAKFVYGMPAGQIALHADVEGCALDRDRVGELVHAALGRAVDRAAPRHETGDGSGVEDHAAVTLLLELDDCVLAADEHAAQVHRDEPIEVVAVWSSKLIPSRGVGMPTLLKRMSSRPKCSTARSDHGRATWSSCETSHSTATRRRPLPRPAARSPWPNRREIGDDDLGAFLGEAQRRRPPDPGAAPMMTADLPSSNMLFVLPLRRSA